MKIIFSISLAFIIGLNFWFTPTAKPNFQAPQSPSELGQQLFFDPILSLDKTISCASCHRPEFAFADTSALSIGVGGKLGTRNTPSVMNMAFRPYFFYDGRAATLEEQIIGPIENPVEMNLEFSKAVQRVQQQTHYQHSFQRIYGNSPDSASLLNAIAEFMRSLESDGSAPHDVWLNGEDDAALTTSQQRGRELFLVKAKCFDCHFGPDFTGDEFRNIGLYDAKTDTDRGRFEISKDSVDLGRFKVPGLRNIALTAPYMHNGRFQTLAEVVDYYDDPSAFVTGSINRDTLLAKPLGLTNQEKADLVAFMESLTDVNFPKLELN